MTKGNTTIVVTIVSIIIVAIGLLSSTYLQKYSSQQTIGNDNLPCLLPGVELAMHIHPKLRIIVDGKEEQIQANIGLSERCEKPIHTHEVDNEIHIESQTIRDYTLQDFFNVWGKPIVREGYIGTMSIDGKPSTEFGLHILKDKEDILLEYKKKSNAQTFSGFVTEKIGNCMPIMDENRKSTCGFRPLATTIVIRELTKVSTEGKTEIIKEIKSDKEGKFTSELPKGIYSVFPKFDGKEDCGRSDGEGNLCGITIGDEPIENYTIIVDHAAY